MITPPLVSICIPAYNCDRYIAATLNCFCRQSYTNLEIIVVNDGSTDHTSKTVALIQDPRIMLINVSNGGAARARNIAFASSSGEFIIFFDADDLIDEEFVYLQVKASQKKNNLIVMAAWGRFTSDDMETFKLDPSPQDSMSFEEWILHYWNNCNAMTNPGRAIIPRKILEKSGLWNERLSLNDDMEFFTRLFLHSEGIAFNNSAILMYRSGISGLSSNKGSGSYASLYNSILWSTTTVTNHYKSNVINRCCANLWQCFVYEVFPYEKQLVKNAENKIREYGGSNFLFPSGGYTYLLSRILGWKATKRVKNLLTIK